MTVINGKELETYLLNISPELYSFSYCLVPDDLQAQQLVIDAFSALLLEEGPELVESSGEDLLVLLKKAYKFIYKQGPKRAQHIKAGLDFEEEHVGFYSLSIDDRALLFLREKTPFDNTDISDILRLQISDCLSRSHSSKERLLKNIGIDY